MLVSPAKRSVVVPGSHGRAESELSTLTVVAVLPFAR
jgi:hypothetical protein